MAIEKPNRKILHIGDYAPSITEYSAWLDTATRTIKLYEGGWVVKAKLAEDGYTGEITHGNNKMTFKNGVLVSYE